MPKICFVSLYSYPLFNPSLPFPFGGSEVRAWLFATGLSNIPENDISFVVYDHGQPPVEYYDRIAVYRHSYYQKNPENPRLFSKITQGILHRIQRYVPPPLRIGKYPIEAAKIKIYRQIDAEVYCTIGVRTLSAELAAFCKQFGKKFILLTGSDDDFSEKYQANSRELNTYGHRCDLCYYALMQADAIVVQTETQARLLQERFGRTSEVIRNPISLDTESPKISFPQIQKPFALWIGKADAVKQPEIVLQLAHRFPEISFVMVMNRSVPDIFTAIQQNRPTNVMLLDWISYHEIELLFSKAFVLINTSAFEGFPNTFLQAGKYGAPILSWKIDPDGFIEREKCGIVAQGDFEKLSQGLLTLHSDIELQQRLSHNLYRYVQNHHQLEDKVQELNQVINTLRSPINV